MHTQLGTRWEGIPTALDRLSWPSIQFGGGGAPGDVDLLVLGAHAEPSFVLRLQGVEFIAAYDETVYWSLAEEPTRPQRALNRIQNSSLLPAILKVHPSKISAHFVLCGGDMCCEAIAYDEFAVTEFASESMARAALAERMIQ